MGETLTAFNSPTSAPFANLALRLALAPPARTPHPALKQLAAQRTIHLPPEAMPIHPTWLSALPRPPLNAKGIAGLSRSRIMPKSLRMSATRRYRLHSGASAVPRRCARRIVQRRETESVVVLSSKAVVGDAEESPTPTPVERISLRWSFRSQGKEAM